MQMRGASWIAFAAAAVFGFGLGCFVELPPNGKYTCATNEDCGGDGYVCTPAGAGPRYCCKPAGQETCDGQDNDCNGVVDDIPPTPCYTGTAGTQDAGICHGGVQACDGGLICAGEVTPRAETCNQLDDNCNGAPDETFNFQSDPQNCGRCGVACGSALVCQDGGCVVRLETICDDGLDNDGDQVADCADSDCVGQVCGTGCLCRNFGKTETACSDSLDNDGDGPIDCADSDCDGGSCGPGCRCNRTTKVEILCNDTLDNDGDGPADCADPDCAGQSCGPGCACAGGQKAESTCSDTQDNDGDGPIDCADSDCDGGSCGGGCTCVLGRKTESGCTDRQDNDLDGFLDGCDTDCSTTGCGTGCACDGGTIPVETNCMTTSGDEDNDGQFNCADSDCIGQPCRSGGRICRTGGACN